MNSPNKTHLLLIIFLTLVGVHLAHSQPPGPPPGGMGMTDMVIREKQTLYKNIEDLSDDQKMLLDGIYEEFAATLKQNMEEMRNNRESMDRETMRAKMQALQEEKNGLIKDVLNQDQYAIYFKQIEGFRRRREQNRPPLDTADTTSTSKN